LLWGWAISGYGGDADEAGAHDRVKKPKAAGGKKVAISDELAANIRRVAMDDEEEAYLRETVAKLPELDAQLLLDDLARHPRFATDAVLQELHEKMPPPEVKYPPELLARLKAEANRRFTPYRKGDRVTVRMALKGGEYTGIYQGIYQDQFRGEGDVPRRKVRIGGRYFLVEDLAPEVRDRFDPELMAAAYQAFLDEEYNKPLKTYREAYQEMLSRHMAERRAIYRDARRQRIRAKLADLCGGKEQEPEK